MTRKEFQDKYNISDDMMKTLEWLIKAYKGRNIKLVDTVKGLPSRRNNERN